MFHGNVSRNRRLTVHCTTMKSEPLLPRKRARRAAGFAVKAEVMAREVLLQTGSLPSQRELRTIVGGGSTRDIVAALQCVRAEAQLQHPLTAVDFERLTDMEAALLHQRVATLVAENAELRLLEAQDDERVRGLERHLLMETSRLRDRLVADAAEQSRNQSEVGRCFALAGQTSLGMMSQMIFLNDAAAVFRTARLAIRLGQKARQRRK